MSASMMFWIIMLAGLLFGLYQNRASAMVWLGNSLVIWILLALLGWRVFGPALHQ